MNDDRYLKLLGQRIHDLRKEQGMSQEKLAERIGTRHTAIGRIERGEVNSTINMLRKIAKELNTHVSELINIE